MAKKVYDIAVKTGEYTNAQGEKKGRWQNVGAVMKGDDGNSYIMLASWFNPAGVPRKEGSESVLLSLFAPKPRDGQEAAPQQRQAAAAPQAAPSFDDDIPF